MPDGGVPSRRETTATTVIGIGGAGTRMLSAVQEQVERAGPETPYTYVAIDSDEASLERAPETATTVALDTSERFRSADQKLHSYLAGEAELPAAGGTARSRSLGRYAADSVDNLDALANQLDYALRTATESAEPGVHQVWLAHSLGGGTGSGLFPLVGALVRELAAGTDHRVVVGGVGSLPRLDALEEAHISPSGPESVYLNAYAALRELAALLDYWDSDPYPMSLEVESEPVTLTQDHIELGESPFDVYGLLGATEEELSYPSYREHKNRSAATTIYALSQMPVTPRGRNGGTAVHGLGRWFGGQRPWDGERLFSIDGGGVRGPVKELEEYVDLRKDVAETEAELGRLEEDGDRLSDAIRYLNGLLDWRPDAEETSVDEAVMVEVRDRAQTYARRQANLDTAEIEGAIASLREELDCPEKIEDETVATYVFARELDRRLTEALDEHAFHQSVDRMLEKYTETSEEAQPADPLERWRSVLEPELSRRRSRAEDELEEVVFRIIRRHHLENVLEEITQDYNRLQTLATEYGAVQKARGEVRKRWREAEDALRNRRNALEERREEKRRAHDDATARYNSLRKERDSLAEELATTRTEETTVLPVGDPDGFGTAELVEILEDATGLTDLIESGVLDARDVAAALKTELDRLQEPTQDRYPHVVNVSTVTAVGLVADAENRDLVASLDEVVKEGTVPPSVVLDRFDRVVEVETAAPFSVDIAAVFAPVALENTSEFGTLHEHYTDPDRNLSEQFGGEITDDDVTQRFAYPELFPNDERVSDYFST